MHVACRALLGFLAGLICDLLDFNQDAVSQLNDSAHLRELWLDVVVRVTITVDAIKAADEIAKRRCCIITEKLSKISYLYFSRKIQNYSKIKHLPELCNNAYPMYPTPSFPLLKASAPMRNLLTSKLGGAMERPGKSPPPLHNLYYLFFLPSPAGIRYSGLA